jgi:lambda family phage portal protein
MTDPFASIRPRLREPGSVILRDFQAAMQARRGGPAGAVPQFSQARSFDAAQVSRLTAGWNGSNLSINALLEQALPLLRGRARQWSRNTGTGRRFLNQVRTGGVGPTGYTLAMRCGDWVREAERWVFKLDKLANDAIERAWLQWCEPGHCEATGKMSFADVCKLQLEVTARDGEYLARRLRGHANRWGYALQVLSTDRLDLNHSSTPTEGHEVRMGVERNEMARAIAYHLLRGNPGDPLRGGRHSERIPADQVFHDFVLLEPEQARGVPWSHAVLLGANMLALFEESAVYAARIGASQMGFFTQAAGDQGPPGMVNPQDVGARRQTGPDGKPQMMTDVSPGALDLLPPGVDFKSFDPKYPSDAFDPFTKSRKRDMAAGLDVAYHNLTGDMSGVNYSSARIAELAERDGWRGIAHWFIGSFVRPTFRDWLETSLLSGAITLANGQPLSLARMDKYLQGAVFRGRGWEWVDPQKEVNAAATARREGFVTRSQVVASKGGDFEENVIEIAQENEILAINKVRLEGAEAKGDKKPKPAKEKGWDDDEDDEEQDDDPEETPDD